MRIKTFEAPTMQEALLLAKQELGDDAVVLNTKHVKAGGLRGLRGSGKVELMAAVDELSSQKTAESRRVGESESRECTQSCSPFSQHSTLNTQLPGKQRRVGESESGESISPQSSVGVGGDYAARIYGASANVGIDSASELAQLRSEVSGLSSIIRCLLAAGQERSALDQPLLVRLGVDEELARGLLVDCLVLDDPALLASALAAKLQAFAVPPSLDARQVIALVGPTGVGKTTTLAKLAARFSLEMGKRVALVTADTYRIGAVEQLRTYARIMGLPLEIALSPEDVASGVAKHADKDVVLIDTVGRSQRSGDHLSDLKSFVDAAHPTETHLVIAASLSREIQYEVVEKFGLFSLTRLILTKLDEAPNRGCLVNLPLRTGLAISCLTAGQCVPQDIDFAEPGKIARLVTEVAR